MIRFTDISNVLGQRLQTLSPAYPIAWPNKDVQAGTETPYLIFDHVPVSHRDPTLNGGGGITEGYAEITVKYQSGVFATKASEIADSVAELFPYALRLPVTGGEITILAGGQVQRPFPDGPYWRTPVRINYSAS